MIKSLLIDLRPLRTSPTFARLLVSTFAGGVGAALTQFALLLQVWQLTQSPVATGMLALFRAAPMFLLTPLGGTIADRCDRRTVMLVTTIANSAIVGMLVVQAFADWRQVWLLYVIAAAQGTAGAIGQPAREAVLPLLVTRDLLGAGRALTTLSWQLTALIGPALAGLITTTWGLRACYLINLGCAAIALIGILGLPSLHVTAPRQPHLKAMADGLRLVLSRRPLRAAFGLDLALTVLAFPIALLPALNQHLGGDAQSLGLLMSCLGLGGIGAGLVSGMITRSDRPGATMAATAFIWCGAVIILGLAPNLIIAAIAMIIWGAADIWFGIPRSTLVQLVAPDEHRGRVAAANQLVAQGGPAIGDARGGLLAAAIGVGPALIIGGICAAGVSVVLTTLLPEARRYRVSDPAADQRP